MYAHDPLDTRVRRQIVAHLLSAVDRCVQRTEVDVIADIASLGAHPKAQVQRTNAPAEFEARGVQESRESLASTRDNAGRRDGWGRRASDGPDTLDDRRTTLGRRSEDPILAEQAPEEPSALAVELFQKGITEQVFRHQTGVMRLEILSLLTAENARWPMWSSLLDKPIDDDVRFSMDVLVEAVMRTHAAELAAYQQRWGFLQERPGTEPGDDPLDLREIVQAVHLAQQRANMDPAIQTMIFLNLEYELVQSLNFLLFDLNSQLSEAGVLTAHDRDPHSAIDDMIQQHVRSSGVMVEEQAPLGTSDDVLFNSLCEILRVWEPSFLDDIPAATHSTPDHADFVVPAKRPLTSHEVFSAIGSLQRWVPKVLEEALGQPDGRLGQQIKDSLVKQAESFGVPPGQSAISADDEKAVDLVDEVFTQNLYERKMAQASRVIVAQMLFPSVKAAILNRQWFAENNHPARRLISSVTVACTPQNGVDPPADLMKMAGSTVDRLVAGFNEDVSVFEVLAQEFQDYLNERSESAGKPATTKTDAARAAITLELELRFKGYRGPESVRAFALDVGVPFLLDMDINGTRGSLAWSQAIGFLDKLLDLRSSATKPVAIDGQLRAQLIRMLTAGGFTGVRAHHKIAEQEDAIHAHYVPEQARAAPRAFDPQSLLSETLRNPTAETPTHNDNAASKTAAKTATSKPATRDSDWATDWEVEDEASDAYRLGPNDESDVEQRLAHVGMSHVDEAFLARAAEESLQKQEQPAYMPDVVPMREAVAAQEDIPPAIEAMATPPADQLQATVPSRVAAAALDAPATLGLGASKPASSRPNTFAETAMAKVLALKVGSQSTYITIDGKVLVVKLSWVSPQRKYLFVDDKGLRVLVGTPEDVTELAKKGRFFPDTTPGGAQNP